MYNRMEVGLAIRVSGRVMLLVRPFGLLSACHDLADSMKEMATETSRDEAVGEHAGPWWEGGVRCCIIRVCGLCRKIQDDKVRPMEVNARQSFRPIIGYTLVFGKTHEIKLPPLASRWQDCPCGPNQAEKLRPSIHFCSSCESVDLAKKLPSRALGGG